MARRLLTIPGIVADQQLGRAHQGIPGGGRSAQARGLPTSPCRRSSPLWATRTSTWAGARSGSASSPSTSAASGSIDDGGKDDLTQGYKVDDIENVVLTQFNGVPVLVKDVAKVDVGYRPRLGIWGRDNEDDVVAAHRGDEPHRASRTT